MGIYYYNYHVSFLKYPSILFLTMEKGKVNKHERRKIEGSVV